MITTSHLIYNWAIAKQLDEKQGENRQRLQMFLLGAVLPDLPTYVFFFFNTFILGYSQQLMWDVLYFDSVWTPIITLSHSLLFWPLLLLLGYTFKKNWLRWLSASALVHITLDFFVHAEDAYRHFWPFSNWTFNSPISYWNPAYYGQTVGLIDTIVVLALLAWLFTQYKTIKIRSLIGLLALGYFLITFTPLLSRVFN